MPDDEQVIADGSAADFWVDTLALIDRYTVVQHAQAAAKKLGFKSVSKTSSAKRLEMYRALRDYAIARDAEEAGGRKKIDADAEQGELFDDAPINAAHLTSSRLSPGIGSGARLGGDMKRDTSNGITIKTEGMATVKCGHAEVLTRYEDYHDNASRRAPGYSPEKRGADAGQ